MAEAMRNVVLLCRNVRRLSTLASQGSFGLVARPLVGKGDATSKLLSSPVWCVESRGGAGGALVRSSVWARAGALRFGGFGTYNEEHANAAVPEEVFEDEVNDDEHPEVAIEKASHELFRQSNAVVNDGSEEEEFEVKELGREKPGADIAREIWSAKEQDGTNVFSDESDKVISKG